MRDFKVLPHSAMSEVCVLFSVVGTVQMSSHQTTHDEVHLWPAQSSVIG